MQRFGLILVVISLLTLFLALPAVSQEVSPAPKAGGPGKGLHSPRGYDVKTVETLAGEVVAPDQAGPPQRRVVRFNLKTEKETITVFLGPAWYVEEQKIKFAAGDQVEVKGSRIMLQGQPAILAAWVKKGDQVLKLRDDNGIPAWAGRRGPRGKAPAK